VGNVLRRNYIHDLVKKGCQSALRFDDAQWYNLAVENVIWNIHGGGITLKHINDVENNIVVNCKKLAGIWIRGNGERYGSNVRRNIFVQYLDQMVEDGDIHPFYEANRNDKTLFKQPMIDDNVLYCPDHPGVANESLAEMQKLGNAKYSIVGNPLFVNMDTGDFRLSENSPALKLGIKSIDQWGLVEPVGNDLLIKKSECF
jgi:hypothetical protein